MASNLAEQLRSMTIKDGPEEGSEITLRPTFYIGLGTFGCSVIDELKGQIAKVAPEYLEGFAFLGIDTHRTPPGKNLGENDYLALSVGVDPNVIARENPEYLEWYLKLTEPWKAKRIRGGADKVKAVGRLALRTPATFNNFTAKLRAANDRLEQYRKHFDQGVPIKVYVISTLAGGTGAGCLLDVLFVVGKFFREAAGADFNYQAILVTPDVLQGEANDSDIPDFCSNTYATLKEVHNFLTSGVESIEKYDNAIFSQVRLSNVLLPNTFHLIGDKNETGSAIVSRIEGLSEIVVAYLLSEVYTPLQVKGGQPRVQDLENSHLEDLGNGGMPRAFSSFGVVRAGFPADIVESLVTLNLIRAVLTKELRSLANIPLAVDNWLNINKAKESGADDLQGQILDEVGRGKLKVSLDAKGTVLQKPIQWADLKKRCQNYRDSMRGQYRQDKKPLVDKGGKDVGERLLGSLQSSFDEAVRQRTVTEAVDFILSMQSVLEEHQKALKDEITSARTSLAKREAEVNGTIGAVDAAKDGWWKRENRVGEELSDFDARLEKLLENDADLWVKENSDEAYATLVEKCRKLIATWSPVLIALQGYANRVGSFVTGMEIRLDHLSDIGKRDFGNRFSLVNADMAKKIYSELYGGEEASILARIRQSMLDGGMFKETGIPPEEWVSKAGNYVTEKEVTPRFRKIDFLWIMNRFYKGDDAIRKLFATLNRLSSPLFCVNPNRSEPSYAAHWIIGVHPSLRKEFTDRYERYLSSTGQGKSFAYFGSPHEVILYQLKLGYTVHSFRELDNYEARYKMSLSQFSNSKSRGVTARPIHSWVDAETWDELIPRGQEAESGKWFILGRAFNYLFPTEGKQPGDQNNVAFLFQRGNYYYMEVKEGQKPITLGKSLEEAAAVFGDRADYQELLRKKIGHKIKELGVSTVREKIEKEYIPILEEERGKAASNPDRESILLNLQRYLKRYIETALRTSAV